ncbi:porin family protein [Rufibacter tibetensis]|uniref:Outer membrane protein beta-barrel domain-containing protein n=1 Tax=Rufibacter tibetensis TaxID=512763 RepID=A0A0P0CAD1_9BACT|nr:porin family protein [Rufibacter tibetensis]ALI98460.1 hypothetical protein DC20_05045 [Rufibacter tibetensis]
MKNFIFSVVLCVGVSSLCSAQDTAGTTQVGILVGPNRTFLSRADNYFEPLEIESDIRGTAGLSVKHQFTSFFIKADLLYENKGDKVDYTSTNSRGYASGEYTLKFNYHYLSVPILLGINIKQTGFFVKAGPYVGWLLKQMTKTNQPGEFPSLEEDQTSRCRRFDVGVSGGIGYSRPISSVLNLSAEVRHNLGILNTTKSSNNIRTNSTNLLLGLHYNLAGK